MDSASSRSTRISKRFGQRVRDARLRAGLTLEGLGKKIGTDKGTMSRIESGRARMGDAAEKAQVLAETLGLQLSDLLPPRRNHAA
jgi:transcriptional regulator with XRE-family HTH domain